MKPLIRDTFWDHVAVAGPDDCWPWLRGTIPSGYGVLVGPEGKQVGAHVYAFYLTHGHWPEQMTLHSCDNPPCCNPAHLRDGSGSDNVQDMLARGRHRPPGIRGERHGTARVTECGVVVIKQMIEAGHTQRSVGAFLGMHHTAVGYILRHR